MSFKNLLDKYKNGNASAEEIKLIEEELDKYEAIEEYLSESYNIGFEKDNIQENKNYETTYIKRGVNKKLRKVIVLSVAIVLAILFTINFIASPIVSSFYYNPSRNIVAKYHDDLYFDLRVLTELNLPGYAINTAVSERLGFGEYNIYFERINLFTRESNNINAKIKRNHRIGNFQDFFENSDFDFMGIRQPDPNLNELTEMQNKEVINHIRALNPVSYISSNVVLDKDISVEEFNELRTKYNKINFKWAGVRTESEGKTINYLSGFNPNFNDGSVSGESADKNKYPYLQLADAMTDRGNNRPRSNSIMVEAFTKHFTSLLKYMNDREKAVAALDYNEFKSEYYKNALNYVEKNGINIYGILIYGEARDLLEFINDQNIKTIEIKGVLPSKYIN